jgi:phosphohistidine phosphatase
MQLYFLRHGLADWPDWDPAQDHLRPLTQDGLKKMKAVAKALARLKLRFDAILSSPYTRAMQTADIVAGQLGLEIVEDARLAPGFNLDRLNEIITRYPTAQALLLVGHEPTLSATITTLIGGGRIVIKKGSLARVEVTSFDPLSGELVWLIASKVLAV